MPGLDRTGPNGEGPKTGRAMGRCNPDSKTGKDISDENGTPENDFRRGQGRGFRFRFRGNGGGPGKGMGRGFGRGQGRGWGRGRGQGQ